MKLTKRKIQAASDYRTFDGYDLDEFQEIYPDLYMDFIYDIRYDVQKVFVSRNPECNFIGVRDTDDGYYVYDNSMVVDPGWYEVTFSELADYLS